MASANVLEITDQNFEALVLQSEKPVLVDFWAPWCGPCRQIAPMIDLLANENAQSLTVGKVNIDDNPDVSRKFQVSSIPTLIFFKGGEVAERCVGGQPKQRLQTIINSLIGAA